MMLDVPHGLPNHMQYMHNSLSIHDVGMKEIQQAAKENNIAVVMGYSEKECGSLYISQVFINEDGEIIGKRRKIKPTHIERTMFGEGDGSDLKVVDFNNIKNVGALSCWENIQPLIKFSMFGLNEQIHVASWPSFCLSEQVFALSGINAQSASMTLATEGQCFVIMSSSLYNKETLEKMGVAQHPLAVVGGGYSMIYAPDGRPLTASLAPTEEGILYADIDLSLISMAKAFGDPLGHYSRPDIFNIKVNVTSRRNKIEFIEDEPMATSYTTT